MARRGWGWSVPAVLLVLMALGGRYASTTPRYALYHLGAAKQRHDVAEAPRHFAVDRTPGPRRRVGLPEPAARARHRGRGQRAATRGDAHQAPGTSAAHRARA